MVDSVLSEENAPQWDFTEDAEETGAVGEFTVLYYLLVKISQAESWNCLTGNTDTPWRLLTGRGGSQAAGLIVHLPEWTRLLAYCCHRCTLLM